MSIAQVIHAALSDTQMAALARVPRLALAEHNASARARADVLASSREAKAAEVATEAAAAEALKDEVETSRRELPRLEHALDLAEKRARLAEQRGNTYKRRCKRRRTRAGGEASPTSECAGSCTSSSDVFEGSSSDSDDD